MEVLYSFDDVLLVPAISEVLPSEAKVSSYLTHNIELKVPIMSSAMDTVTDSRLAIELAKHGGMGCIHKNFTISEQVDEVRRVKKYESWIVYEPITISPDSWLSEALELMSRYSYSGIPVVEGANNRLVGIITNRDVRFVENKNLKVRDVMTKDNLITVPEGIDRSTAMKLLHQHRIEKLIVVNHDYRCVGLITVKDIEKFNQFPDSCKDERGRLRVAAAIGTGKIEGMERAEALISESVDVLVVDTAHGHSSRVMQVIKELKHLHPDVQIVGGNIATAEAAEALIDVGVDAVKVGVGPGSICTTRIITGVGVPQLSAVMNVAKICKKRKVKLIADGGIKYSGDLAKAIAAGADVCMIGSLFAGTTESPGEIIVYKGRAYKSYRGMGSVGAMQKGSADRYLQDSTQRLKLVPEGVEGRVPLKGPISGVIHQLVGGLKASMGYTGNKDIESMKNNCQFVVITSSGLRESHAHDVTITSESPNYISSIDDNYA